VIRRGLKRLAKLITALCVGTTVLSLLVGYAAGTGALRAVSLGFMLVGSFLFTAGAAFGLRGGVRTARRADGTVAGVRVDRMQGLEMMNVSAVFVGIGIALVLVGVVLHPHVHLI
jgi:hypothetical protein